MLCSKFLLLISVAFSLSVAPHENHLDQCGLDENRIKSSKAQEDFLGVVGCKEFYTYVTGLPLTWINSMEHCHGKQKELVTLSNPRELDFVVGKLRELGRDQQSYWVAATDFIEEGSFLWYYSHLPIDRRYMNATIKDTARSLNCLCMGAKGTSSATFTDVDCKAARHYSLCQAKCNVTGPLNNG